MHLSEGGSLSPITGFLLVGWLLRFIYLFILLIKKKFNLIELYFKFCGQQATLLKNHTGVLQTEISAWQSQHAA